MKEREIAMEKMQPEFKFLEDCQPCELVRLNLGDQTQWALTGQPGNGLFPVIVLTGDDSPRCINAATDAGGNLKIHFIRVPTLSYDRAYSLLPDLAGPCDVHDGPLFSANGALIITGPVTAGSVGPILIEGATFLRVKFSGGRGYVHFDLTSGRFSGAPEGNQSRAAFGNWTLLLNDNVCEREQYLRVKQFSATLVRDDSATGA